MSSSSKNPFFNNKSFSGEKDNQVYDATIIADESAMTVAGAVNKTLILFSLLVASASITWWMAFNGQNAMVYTIGGAIVGFVLVLIAAFRPQNSGFLAPGYAIFEGLFIGGISSIFELKYPGIVVQAVGATLVTFLVCLVLYRYQIVKVTEQFKSVVMAATFAIATFYLLSWILSFFMTFTPIHHSASPLGIGVSVFVIIIAALNIFVDFDQIDQGAKRQLPKYMEWFSAMGMMITLVWLYVEFLRLLSKLNKK